MERKSRSERRQYVEKKLIFRLRMFAVIFFIMCSIAVYDIYMGYLNPVFGMGGMAGGIALGLLVGRAYNVVWHEEANKAISKMDAYGIAIIVAYILFAIFRKKLFGYWLHGPQLSAFVLCFSSGIMLGRLLTLRRRIKKVLKSQDRYYQP